MCWTGILTRPSTFHLATHGFLPVLLLLLSLQSLLMFCGYRENFRCCTPFDDADRCVHNNTYPGHDAYQAPSKSQAHDFMMGSIFQGDTAATCKWQVLGAESCPGFLKDPACLVVEMNW